MMIFHEPAIVLDLKSEREQDDQIFGWDLMYGDRN
jgi:hypothetical protein